MKPKKLDIYETVVATELLKSYFERQLCTRLSLTKVVCPLFVITGKGVQDGLAKGEEAVAFKAMDTDFEIVHSLAKWKRMALKRYGFKEFTGIITDMKAIRKDDDLDETHSYLVDQWDWEKIITKETRTIDTLKSTVTSIYKAIRQTSIYMKSLYPCLSLKLPKTITFITSQELEDLYPDKTPKIREYLITKEHKAAFIIGIGDKLKSGEPHDDRSPDYDDWTMDGDLLIFDEILDKAVEMTSMGIRVDKKALIDQLKKSDKLDYVAFDYHQAIIKDEVPLTIGGGIGQSRLCMLLLEKRHIGEVQATFWPETLRQKWEQDEIKLL